MASPHLKKIPGLLLQGFMEGHVVLLSGELFQRWRTEIVTERQNVWRALCISILDKRMNE